MLAGKKLKIWVGAGSQIRITLAICFVVVGKDFENYCNLDQIIINFSNQFNLKKSAFISNYLLSTFYNFFMIWM